MLFPFQFFYCCLAPTELIALQTLAAGYLTGSITVLQDDFFAFWATIDPDNNFIRRRTFIVCYAMVLSTCDNGQGEFVPCYVLNGSFWTPFALFTLSPEAACLDGCPEILFHLPD